jgi:hypothetical protein
MKLKLAGTGKNHIPWKEQIDLLEVDALSDEYAWDDLLEAAEDGSAGSASSVRRISTPTPNFHRLDTARKTAAATNWDSEFSSAQAHARDLISKLGNG